MAATTETLRLPILVETRPSAPLAHLGRALAAEILKTRRTLALAMTVLAPLVIAVMQFGLWLDRLDAFRPAAGQNPWLNFAQGTLVYWTLLMMPLFVTLETALLNGVDHQNRHWALLYTLPVPRWTYYAAKVIVSLGLIALSMVVLLVFMRIGGLILQALGPQLGLDAAVPWATILRYTGLSFLSSGLLIALHLWVSRRWSGFVFPLGFGIAATVAAVFIVNRMSVAQLYPWTIPGVVANAMREGDLSIRSLLIGSLGGLALAVFGAWDTARRDVL